jgi:hypothetical protein
MPPKKVCNRRIFLVAARSSERSRNQPVAVQSMRAMKSGSRR